MSSEETTEPFPVLSTDEFDAQTLSNNAQSSPSHATRPRTVSAGAGRTGQSRGQSLVQNFVTSNPPLGMWQAAGEVGSKVPTLPEIRDGAFDKDGWSLEGQRRYRGTDPHEVHQTVTQARTPSVSSHLNGPVTKGVADFQIPRQVSHSEGTTDETLRSSTHHTTLARPYTSKENRTVEIMDVASNIGGPDLTGTYPNGYRFPRKHTWSQSTVIGLKGFWKFFITPLGFLVTVYALNVVGWGAMIFFLLIGAAPAMCHPSCNDEYSARRIWIEIDAQVLTALFCVTAFGLIPWRFRDFYYLMRWRVGGNYTYHRKLAGIYRSWYRLPGSNKLADDIGPPLATQKNRHTCPKHPQADDNPPAYTTGDIEKLENNAALPLPSASIPDAPLTGIRAAPTRTWNLDIVIWMYLMNTWIQVPLCGIMWGMNRFNRPSWATGFLITIGCLSGIAAGIVVFIENSKVKKMEGIPVKEYDVVESIEDYQQRKAKEDAREAKKKQRGGVKSDALGVEPAVKVKGDSWFVRH